MGGGGVGAGRGAGGGGGVSGRPGGVSGRPLRNVSAIISNIAPRHAHLTCVIATAADCLLPAKMRAINLLRNMLQHVATCCATCCMQQVAQQIAPCKGTLRHLKSKSESDSAQN